MLGTQLNFISRPTSSGRPTYTRAGSGPTTVAQLTLLDLLLNRSTIDPTTKGLPLPHIARCLQQGYL